MGLTSSLCCTDRSGVRRQSRPLSSCYVDFCKPAEVTQQGGAQARLFRLVPVVNAGRPTGGGVPEWLGKDVSSGFNEVDFYNEVLHMRRLLQQDPPLQLLKVGQQVKEEDIQRGPWSVVDFMVSYHGLARNCTCSWTTDGKERTRVADLLVFRSPFEGLARPRMLHLELGPRTLALQARHENAVATGILARQEGISVDGFLAPPASIASEGPTLDLRGWSWGDNTQRRAKRLPLQHLRLSQALSSLVDLRSAIAEERFWPSEDTSRTQGAPDTFLEKFLSATEYSEQALLALVRELVRLLRAVEEVPVPQKWVQSSLALLVEAGVAPPRVGPIHPATWVASRVKVQILGWNKSRLSLASCTSEDECQDNELPWKIYQHHLGRVLWESSRLYFHSYCVQEWRELTLHLCEVSKGCCTPVAKAELSMAAIESQPFPLQGEKLETSAQLWLSVRHVTLPTPSTFTALWQVRVERVEGIEAAETMCVVLSATSAGGRQTMSHKSRELSKGELLWKEDFEFPLAPGQEKDRLAEALGLPNEAGRRLAANLPLLEEWKSIEKEDVHAASAGQVAFLSELHAGWYGPKCGLIDQ